MASSSEKQWSGKSRGGKFGYQFFAYTIRLLGIRCAYCFLAFIVIYFIPFAPKATRAIWSYNRQRRRLGILASVKELYCHYYVFGQTLVDKIENQNVAYNLDNRAGENRWEKPGDATPYVGFSPTGANTPASTRFIMDDNEIRLATMNVGYRFTGEDFKYLRRANIDVLALNFTTNDLARISTIKMERGLDYPFARSYTLSLSIMFR